MKNYKKELKELKKLPKGDIRTIYLIPSRKYNGFWGSNGYRSYDFIIGDGRNTYGWFHWEGDVIDIINPFPHGLTIDSEVENSFIRMFTGYKFIINGLEISSCEIRVERD